MKYFKNRRYVNGNRDKIFSIYSDNFGHDICYILGWDVSTGRIHIVVYYVNPKEYSGAEKWRNIKYHQYVNFDKLTINQ